MHYAVLVRTIQHVFACSIMLLLFFLRVFDIFMSPLCRQRWGHVASPLSAQSVWVCAQSVWVCAVSLPFISLQHFLSCKQLNTRRRPNAGLMLAHRLRRWPNISPVLGYRVVFGAMLNVSQRHRRWANINPALVQYSKASSWNILYSRPCVSVTCISPMPGYCVRRWPTFKRHWGGVCYVYSIPPAWSTQILTRTEWILASPARMQLRWCL